MTALRLGAIGLLVSIGVAGSPGLAQGALNADVPRTIYISTQDGEFRKMDADKNGQVTRAEIEGFERTVVVAQARAQAQAMFAQLDADRNGQLSPVEFAKLSSGAPAVDGRPLLAKLDSNKDGQISMIEHRAGKLVRFDQIDLDKDGTVTVAEMKAAGVVK